MTDPIVRCSICGCDLPDHFVPLDPGWTAYCGGDGCDNAPPIELPEDDHRLLQLAALAHNVKHLLVRLEVGAKPHKQDAIDARRWLPKIEQLLRELPEPKRRVIEAGELGGAGPVALLRGQRNMSNEIEELQRLAEAALAHQKAALGEGVDVAEYEWDGIDDMPEEWLTYYAAASPECILRLIADRNKLNCEVEDRTTAMEAELAEALGLDCTDVSITWDTMIARVRDLSCVQPDTLEGTGENLESINQIVQAKHDELVKSTRKRVDP